MTDMKYFKLLMILTVAVLFSSCYDVKQKFVLNPDGTGKVFFEGLFIPGDNMKEQIKSIFERSNGIDAWRDVSYNLADDGRLMVKATAYFRDISKIEIHKLHSILNNAHHISFTDDKGNKILEYRFGAASKKIGKQKEKKELSEEEITQEMQKEKKNCGQMESMLNTLLGSIRVENTFVLPGTIEKATNFTINEDKSVVIGYDGEGLLKMMDDVCNDDDLLRQRILSEHGMLEDNEIMDLIMNQLLFGKRAINQVVLTGDMHPLFNYDDELAKAKKDFAKFEKNFDKNYEKVFGSTQPNVTAIKEFLWTFKTGLDIDAPPILSDNSLFISATWMSDGNLFCIDTKTGKETWKFETGDIFRPKLGNGIIYFIGSDKDSDQIYDHLYAIDTKTGHEIWKIKSEMETQSLNIDNGTVYYHAWDSLFAINGKSGEKEWSIKVEGFITKSSLYVSDGDVYFSDRNNVTFACDGKTGQERWQFKTIGTVQEKPIVYDGTVYFEDEEHHIYAIDAQSGKEKWKYKVLKHDPASYRVNTAIVVTKGVVYRTCTDSSVIAIDSKSGTLKWQYKAESVIEVSPKVHNGVIYFDDGNYLCAVNSKKGTLTWKSKPEGEKSSYYSNRVSVYNNHLYLRGFIKWGEFYCSSMKTGKGIWRIPHFGLKSYPIFDGETFMYATGKAVYAIDLKAQN